MSEKYHHLSLDERRKLYFMRQDKVSIEEIANVLGRHRSTIYREIKRNYFYDELELFSGYNHVTAHEIALERRFRLSKLHMLPDLKEYVIEKLKHYWSPEQIAGYLRRIASKWHICHETIYRFIYSKEGLALGLYQYLCKHRKKRRKRYGRKDRVKRIPESKLISNRPTHINEREEFGHWECDLMIFNRELNSQTNVSTLVERKTRYTMMIKNPNRKSSIVLGNIKQHMRSYSSRTIKIMTFDQGSEFMLYSPLQKHLNIEIYFCEPHSPWQKGAVENTNARIRRFLPRETDLLNISEEKLSDLVKQINHIPRKCLNYYTPYEALHSHL